VIKYLVGVGKTTHTGHDTEDIVVDSVHADLAGTSVSVHGQVQGSVVNTGEVGASRGVVFLGLQGEGVDIDTGRFGDVGMCLVGLDQVEVAAGAESETVLSVQLELSRVYSVHCTGNVSAWVNSVGIVTSIDGGVVRPLVVSDLSISLGNPHKFLDGVVEAQFQLSRGTGDRFFTSELELFNQVFVRDLSESAAFFSVQVDIVHPQGSRRKADGGGGSSIPDDQFREGSEFQVDLDFVVLKGDQGEGQTSVAAEPELQRNEHGGFITVFGTKVLERSADRSITMTDHIFITVSSVVALVHTAGKFVPDLEPVTVLTVNALSSDFDFHLLNQMVTDMVNPSETVSTGKSGESSLQVHTANQVTAAGNQGSDLATEVSGSVEGLFNRFNGKVGMTTVHNLEVSNLRVASQVDILGTISDDLH